VERQVRDVEESHDAGGRVHDEADHLAAGRAHAELEQVVHEAARHLEVVERAAEAALRRVGEGLVPAGRDRPHQPAVEHVVIEEEHALVERLPGVVVLRHAVLGGVRDGFRDGLRVRRHRAQHHRDGDREHRQLLAARLVQTHPPVLLAPERSFLRMRTPSLKPAAPRRAVTSGSSAMRSRAGGADHRGVAHPVRLEAPPQAT
jgi:hypothetical protein